MSPMADAPGMALQLCLLDQRGAVRWVATGGGRLPMNGILRCVQRGLTAESIQRGRGGGGVWELLGCLVGVSELPSWVVRERPNRAQKQHGSRM